MKNPFIPALKNLLKIKKVLFVGGGRRVSLAKIFIENNYEVFSYELSKEVPISEVSTIVGTGLKWNDEKIYNELIRIIVDNDIDLVIPLMDEAIVVCAKLKELVHYPFIVAPSVEVANICLNKDMFETYMLKQFPDLYPKFDGTYPLIVKPKRGFGSRGIKVVYEPSSRNQECDWCYDAGGPDDICMKYIKGIEYTVDCYFDTKNKYVDGMVRERLRVFDGEVISSVVVYEPKLTDICKCIGEDLKLVGPVNIQFIRAYDDRKIYVIEINHRFGGGTILSMKAGLNIMDYLNKEYIEHVEETLKHSENKKFLKMERYLSETYFGL